MFASSVIALVLAASSAAAVPFPQAGAAQGFRPSPGKRGGNCDISNLTLTDVAGLAAPSGAPSFVGVGAGVQNYTCGAAGTYTSTGAVADIFDISCLSGTPMFATVQDKALNGVPAGAPLLGKHFFIGNADGSISPKWDFSSSQKSADAVVVAKKDAQANAPTGAQDVAWLQLSSVSGSLASSVYRVDTRKGQPPASCTAGSSPDVSVKYSSKYYFFGGSVKAATQ